MITVRRFYAPKKKYTAYSHLIGVLLVTLQMYVSIINIDKRGPTVLFLITVYLVELFNNYFIVINKLKRLYNQ